MASEKAMFILRSMVDIDKKLEWWRNRHVKEMTGFQAQDIDYYLKKWEKSGFLQRNPRENKEWQIIDLSGLLEELSNSSVEKEHRHMKPVSPLSEARVNVVKEMAEDIAGFRALEMTGYKEVKDYLLQTINQAISELKNEIVYINTKKVSPRKAAQRFEKNNNNFREKYGADLFPADFDDELRERIATALNLEKPIPAVVGLQALLNVDDDYESTKNNEPMPKDKNGKSLPKLETGIRLHEHKPINGYLYLNEKDTTVCPFHQSLELPSTGYCQYCENENRDDCFPYDVLFLTD